MSSLDSNVGEIAVDIESNAVEKTEFSELYEGLASSNLLGLVGQAKESEVIKNAIQNELELPLPSDLTGISNTSESVGGRIARLNAEMDTIMRNGGRHYYKGFIIKGDTNPLQEDDYIDRVKEAWTLSEDLMPAVGLKIDDLPSFIDVLDATHFATVAFETDISEKVPSSNDLLLQSQIYAESHIDEAIQLDDLSFQDLLNGSYATDLKKAVLERYAYKQMAMEVGLQVNRVVSGKAEEAKRLLESVEFNVLEVSAEKETVSIETKSVNKAMQGYSAAMKNLSLNASETERAILVEDEDILDMPKEILSENNDVDSMLKLLLMKSYPIKGDLLERSIVVNMDGELTKKFEKYRFKAHRFAIETKVLIANLFRVNNVQKIAAVTIFPDLLKNKREPVILSKEMVIDFVSAFAENDTAKGVFEEFIKYCDDSQVGLARSSTLQNKKEEELVDILSDPTNPLSSMFTMFLAESIHAKSMEQVDRDNVVFDSFRVIRGAEFYRGPGIPVKEF